MAEENPPPSSQRSLGRGRLVLEAMQSSLKDPASQAPSVTTSHQPGSSSGYSSLRSQLGVTTDQSDVSSISSQGSGGRGLRLARFISNLKSMQSQTAQSEEPRLGRGRGNLQALIREHSESSHSTASETKSLEEDLSRVSLSSEPPDEPISHQGTSGVKIEAITNWIHLALDKDKAVFEYIVDFKPAVDALNLRCVLINSLKDKFGNVKSFDGSTLWLPVFLPQQVMELSAQCKHSGEIIKITIKFSRRTSMAKCTQLYNVLFNRVMKVLKHVLIGRNYFSPANAIQVPQHKLQIWPGYVTAVHHMEGGVMLCVDVSHRVLRSTTAYEVMSEIAKFQKSIFQQECIKAIVGQVVLTQYNNKCYRVDDIMFDSNPLATFTSSRGEEISYMDYYKNAYNINIRDRNQPLLVNKPKKRDLKSKIDNKMICLIPELCYLTGLTDEMRADFRVMKDLAMHTRLTPTAKQACLRKFVHHVNDNPEAKQILSDWGLTLLDHPVDLTARVVAPEPIIFGTREIEGSPNADWSRECSREKVIHPVDLKTDLWLILYIARDESRVMKFVDTFRQVTNCMGIFVGNPKMLRLPNDSTQAYVNALQQSYQPKLQLAVVVFPTPREDRYSAIKRHACSLLGLPTQCLNIRTISQESKLRSITQKIALQINCKLGGELWALKIPMSGLMVCGMDVYHDPINKNNSVVGFVASLNGTITKWYSQALFQKQGDEIIHIIKMALLGAIKQYYQEQHNLPRSIILYRDGVSDGMLKVLEEHEIPQIISIFRNFESYDPKFYVVVVQKRINTRIFQSLSGRGTNNPPPGTVVDHTITKRQWYDFLLVSQIVRQGTVTPSHYVVVKDAEALKPEHMQRLTYKLTHLYYNWPGTIRVPAPCQYAHKLAYLIGQNVRKDPHSGLQDKLYYL